MEEFAEGSRRHRSDFVRRRDGLSLRQLPLRGGAGIAWSFPPCGSEDFARPPVSRVLSPAVVRRVAVIHLEQRLPVASRDLPGGGAGRAVASLFGLAPGGACPAGRSPDRWCALTAPFHPYRAPARTGARRYVSVALSVRLPCLGVTQRPVPWSPDFPRPRCKAGPRPPGGLAAFTVPRRRLRGGALSLDRGPRWRGRRRGD